MMKLILFANDPGIIQAAARAGVDRICVDLEILGKKERQGHLDTVMSGHTIEDVARARQALQGDGAELLVRINPLHAGTRDEVDQVIERGAQWIMLPMFRSASELREVTSMIRGRARFVPLVETPEAIDHLDEIARTPGVDEIFIGLNDLHLAYGMKFMFEVLERGILDQAAAVIREAKCPFGFGGIGRIGEGALPADLILAEHSRLGSTSVILSRSFTGRARTLEELQSKMDLGAEVRKVRDCESRLAARSSVEIERDAIQAKERVKEHVRNLRVL